jgi:transposase-like protein
MDVLRVDLSDEGACYGKLLELLHPGGLACPRCRARDGLGVHRRRRHPVLDYQCAACGRVFNAWTGTPLEKTHRHPSHILKILGGTLPK